MNYFLVLNLFFKCFFTGKFLSVRFLLTHPVDFGGWRLGQLGWNRGGFFKNIPIGIPAYAGMKTGC